MNSILNINIKDLNNLISDLGLKKSSTNLLKKPLSVKSKRESIKREKKSKKDYFNTERYPRRESDFNFKVNLKNILKTIKKQKENFKKIILPKRHYNKKFRTILGEKSMKKIKSEKSAKLLYKTKILKKIKNEKIKEKDKKFQKSRIQKSFLYLFTKKNKNFDNLSIKFKNKISSTKYIKFNNMINIANSSMLKLTDNNIIILGGISHKVFKKIYLINIKNKKKKIIKLEKKKNINFKRYGHTTHLYKNHIIVVGGFNNNQKLCNYYNFKNLFYEIDLKNFVYKYKDFYQFPEPRIYHGSVLFKDFLVVFGGENLYGKILNDLWIFSFRFFKWEKLDLSFSGFLKEGIFKHKLSVLIGKKKNEQIFQNMDFNNFEDSFIYTEDDNINNLSPYGKSNKFFFSNDKNEIKIKKFKNISNKKCFLSSLKDNKKNIKKIKNNSTTKRISKKNNFNICKLLVSKSLAKKKEEQIKLPFIDDILTKSLNKKNLKTSFYIFNKKKEKKKKNDNSKKMSKILAIFILELKKNTIVLFGGKKGQTNKIDNKIKFLKYNTEKKKFYFKNFPINKNLEKENSPESRFSHSMHIYKKKNLLIIYGGVNIKGDFLNDFWIFDFDNFFWKKIYICGPLNIPRACHCSLIFNDLFIVYGGINSNGYLSTNIFICYLDEKNQSKNLESEKQLN